MSSDRGPLKVPDDAKWVIDRLDRWRSSIATRCALVVSADALLLAGYTFLLDKAIARNWMDLPRLPHWSFGFMTAAGMLCLLASLFNATTGIANVWRPSRVMLGPELPDRMFLHPSEIVVKYATMGEMVARFREASDNDVDGAIWAEVWSLAQMHHRRYQRLRRAIALMVAALPIYFCCVMIVVLRYLPRS
jgi:hypothetical protein